MDLQLKGRKALVTGASRGIGRAIANRLAAEGCALALCARGDDGLRAVLPELEAQGAQVHCGAVDVSDGNALRRFVTEAVEALGGLDIFVHNASAFGGTDEEGWRGMFDIDLMGAVRGVDAAMPALGKSDAASVVFIATTAAVEAFRGPRAYNAVKAALIAHANSLSQALGPEGVRVNSVSPGPIYSPDGPWGRVEKNDPAFFEATKRGVALGRLGTPEEVANAVAFLASPAAAFITGANLIVDGGFTRRVQF